MKQVIMKDRIDFPQMKSLSRYDPIPEPYIIHIRERFNSDGTVDEIHRKRVYDGGLEDTDERCLCEDD